MAVRIKREIIQIDETIGDSCEKCIWFCVEGALRMIDGKLRLAAEKF